MILEEITNKNKKGPATFLPWVYHNLKNILKMFKKERMISKGHRSSRPYTEDMTPELPEHIRKIGLAIAVGTLRQ